MLYSKYLQMHLKSSLEYRVNSFLVMFSQIFINLSELISIYILFSQCKSIGNWGFYETALMYGIILTVYSFAECFARGYEIGRASCRERV